MKDKITQITPPITLINVFSFLLAFLAACESPLQPDSLPQGVYPLQIGNVRFTAEVTE